MTKDKLKYGYTYLIYDESINDIPIEASCMEIEETGEYYSFSELSMMLGAAFKPVPFLKEGMMLVHLSLGLGEDSNGDNDEKEMAKEIKKLLKTDMRSGIKKGTDIDFANVPVDSFGFFSAYEIKDVPSFFEGEVG